MEQSLLPMPQVSEHEIQYGLNEKRRRKNLRRIGYDERTLERQPVRDKIGGWMLKTAGITMCATTSIGATLYFSDVHMNQMEREAASISVTDIYLNPEADTTAIAIDGFNAYDGYYYTKKMLPAFKELSDANVASLDYNNAILNREDIAAEILEKLEQNDNDNMYMYGYSMGGIISTEAVADIVVDSDKTVDVLALFSTPSGFEGLRETQQAELEFGKNIVTAIPGAEYSSFVRYLGEIYFYRDNYFKADGFIDAAAFARTVDGINKRYADNVKSTSMDLLIQQIYKIANVDYDAEFARIASMYGEKQLPVIVYFGTKAPAVDTVVNDVFSGDAICEAAEKNGLTCLRFEVEDAKHSLYYQTIPQYQTALADAKPFIDAAIEANERQYELYVSYCRIDQDFGCY